MENMDFLVVQEPGVISVQCDELKVQLESKMNEYMETVFTEDTKKDAKSDLAELRKLKKAVNDRKTEVKDQYMKPYSEFEERVKELVELIDKPINYIDGQVKQFEEKRVNEKNEAIRKAYEEIVPEELKDYIPLERIYGSKWKNTGTALKTIRQEIESEVVKTNSEIAAIRATNSDEVEHALNVYMADRSLVAAMRIITSYEAYKGKIKEQEREAERERIRKEEREKIREEERIKQDAKKEAVEELKQVDEAKAAPLSSRESVKVVYTVVATKEEQEEIEMALTSLGVYFERKTV